MKRFSPDPDPPSGFVDPRASDPIILARMQPAGNSTPPIERSTIIDRSTSGPTRYSGNRRKLGASSTNHAWRRRGTIRAGLPEEPFDEPGERITRIEDLLPGIRPDDFFLVVDGDSMIDAGLQPGQYVVIRPEMPRRNGEICAVWVEGTGATLKRVYFDHDLVRLVPANPNYAVQIYPADEVRIQGVLVAALAIRNFRR